MAIEVPWDVPHDPFTRAGLMALDGDVFEGKNKVGTNALFREIEYVKNNVAEGNLQTQSEWQQVRNVVLLWCFSYRTENDDQALNTFLKYVGLNDLDVPNDIIPKVFGLIEAKHNHSPPQPSSPADWIKQRPPPQRLPTPASLLLLPQDHQQDYVNLPTATLSTGSVDSSTFTHTPRSSLGFNTNPKFHGKYDFTDHRQEYEGYQFQCIFRCLKDGKHCRKAPVREMNRHLRDRHHFRQGFKIAGVDWERKRWRGAGADHEECVGKIVEKDCEDPSDDSGSEGEYTVT